MLDRTIDFTNCKRAHVTYGGSDRKFGVIYNGDTYMLKFSEHHAKRHDVSTSYVNNAISEYIGSHISQSVGLPTHDTVLGTYDGEIVVGCKDFRSSDNVATVEFAEYVRAKYDSYDVKRLIKLSQIYNTLKDPQNDISPELQDASIRRFWDTFVIDALVGNFDRHIGNWGFLAKDNILTLAPVYDYGSTMFPQASDEGAQSFMDSPLEMIKRTLQFPSPALAITDEKTGKVGYYEMLSSNYDHNCTEALMRIAPKIDLNSIKGIIDNTPFITDVRKEFYKEILQLRFDAVINRAYVRCLAQEYDLEAKERMISGKSITDQDLVLFLEERRLIQDKFVLYEKILSDALEKMEKGLQVEQGTFVRVANEQRRLIETFGLHSEIPVAVLTHPTLFIQNASQEVLKGNNELDEYEGQEDYEDDDFDEDYEQDEIVYHH